ncbi:MAG: hypothetical protein HW421_2921 [Ignavibacteria bacterium]|nr:hypothetical protein [Ignavibacteria bacterium]
MKKIYYKIDLIMIIIMLIINYHSQAYTTPEVRVTYSNRPSPGYIFLAPFLTGKLAICDNTGTPVILKQNTSLGQDYINLTIQENGKLTYFDVIERKFYSLDVNLNKVDSFYCVNGISTDYHGLKVLSNNHALLLGIVDSTIDMRRYIQGGNPSARVHGQMIQEIDENKNVVFQWNSFEHIPIVDATDDVNLTGDDILYIHSNAILKDLDGNYLLCSRHLDEITKINKNNGQIIWRMGGSKCKNNQFTFINDTVNGFFGFSHQHDIQVLPNGNFLILDNGNLKPNPFTRAVEYEVNQSSYTVRKVWEYRNNPDLNDPFMGSVQRLDNGNTFIGWGGLRNIGENNDDDSFNPIVTEVKPDGTKVFELNGKGISSYLAKRYVYKMNTDSRTISNPGIYLFDNSEQKTNFEINVNSVDLAALVTVEKHNYTAKNIVISGDILCTNYPFRWVVTYSQNMNVTGEIKFKLENIPQIILSQNLVICFRSREGEGQFTKLQTTLIQSSKELKADFRGEGEYIICSKILEEPLICSPDNIYNVSTYDTLHWDNVVGADSYTLELSEFVDFHQNIISKADIIDNYLKFDGLDSGTVYYWHMRSINTACESQWSKIRSFTTVLQKPFLIMPLNNSNSTPVVTTLSWSAVKNSQNYQLMVSDNPNFENKIYNDSNLTLTFQIINNLNYNTKYYWKVRGIIANNPGPWSDIFSFSTKLLAPELKFPIDDAVGVSATVTLEWKPSLGAEVYSAQVSDNPNFYNPIDDQSGITSTKIIFSNLLNNEKYYWRIKSSNQLAKSDWSEVWEFTTVFGAPNLQLPKNKAVGVNKSVYLYWGTVPKATSYNVQISLNVNFTNPVVDKSKIQNNFLSYDSLDFSKNYYWRISGTNADGTGPWSDIFSFQTVSESFNVPPLLQTPTNNMENIPTSQNFSWLPTQGADKYRIQIAIDTNFEKIFIDDIVQSRNYYTASGLSNFKKYYWHILAMNDYGTSSWSDTWEFQTIIGPPVLSFPENNKIDLPLSGQLSWLSSEGADSYNVQISKSNTFDINVTDFTLISDTTIQYKDLEYSSIYYWRVAANRNSITSNWSNPYTFKTQASSPVEEETVNTGLYIQTYPKPASEEVLFDINMSNLYPLRLKIFDFTGILLKDFVIVNAERNHYTLKWETRDIASGNYFFVAVCGSDILSGTVIIIR